MPEVAISASVKAVVQPEFSRTSPRVFHRAISVCRPPIITTYICSPCVVGHLHYTYFAKANNGWSKVVTQIYPGFRLEIACLWVVIPCLIIDGVADFLEKRGTSEHTLGGSSEGSC